MTHGYQTQPAGCGVSTELPGMDFETYSEAGFNFIGSRWKPVNSSGKNGIYAVGAPAYSQHPSTEVLCLAYDLKDGRGGHLWVPGCQPPEDLFFHIAAGGIIEARNSRFEYLIWKNVCNARMGWPALPLDQLRDSAAKCRAHGLPGGLGESARITGAEVQKNTEGDRLIKKFCVPHNPTKKDPRKRILPSEEPADAALLYQYCIDDVGADSATSCLVPDVTPFEAEVCKVDHRINIRGVALDVDGVKNCQVIVEQALIRGVADLLKVTEGAIKTPSQTTAIPKWLATQGCHISNLQEKTVTEALKSGDLTPGAKQVLEIRAALGSASVKKLSAMLRRLSTNGRLQDLFMYAGATRTARWTGSGVQPQNLTASGPDIVLCSCGKHYGTLRQWCPWCYLPRFGASEVVGWNLEAVEDVLNVASSRSMLCMEYYFGGVYDVISGCLRGLFHSAPGHDFICSDFAAIEAVVLAVVAGEEWRIEVFRTHGRIYEMSAAKITGIPFDEFLKHKKDTGEHHPMRKKVGKVAELASGYQGGVGAWKAFGAEEYFSSDDEIQNAVNRWRADSPKIVQLWKRAQAAAFAAIKTPGSIHNIGLISYGFKDGNLYCRLPSGRLLTYWSARIAWGTAPWGDPIEKIYFMGWVDGHWAQLDTFGGRLVENFTQAIARDIQAASLVRVEAAGYPVVMHTHDEIISEVREAHGSIEEFETIMGEMPPWASDWPIRAAGGWRGKRYRKD